MPGLANTRVIHPAFQAHHRPVADGQMTAACVITRPASAGTPTFDEATATSQHPAPATIYPADGSPSGGPCRITRQPLSANTQVVADRAVTEARYRVTLPADAPPAQVNDLVKVVACDDEPSLVGQRLKVTEVLHGSITWQRDVLCEFSQPTTR